MKQLYILLCVINIFIGVIFSHKTLAQPCSCPGGDPIDSVVQHQMIQGIVPFSTNLNFNQFDPSIGSLTCVFMRSYSTYAVVNGHIANRDSTARQIYELLYSRVVGITGPGINVNASSPSRDYGPYDLGQAGVDVDTTVDWGPDTLIKLKTLVKTTSNVVPYTGTGSVVLKYLNTPSTTWLQGTSNMLFQINDYTKLDIWLSYYWCPQAALATNITSFSVANKDPNVVFVWQTENEEPGRNYYLQYSTDGKEFKNVGLVSSTTSGAANYKYQLTPIAGASGNVYVRIRQVDADGKVSYTPVKLINLGSSGQAVPFSTFPNPVTRNVNLMFARPVKGNVMVELVNNVGQVVERQRIFMNQSDNFALKFNSTHPTGLYYLKATEIDNTEHKYTTRIFIQ